MLSEAIQTEQEGGSSFSGTPVQELTDQANCIVDMFMSLYVFGVCVHCVWSFYIIYVCIFII